MPAEFPKHVLARSSQLQKLNQVRWQQVGQLLRTAAILTNMQSQYPEIRYNLGIAIHAMQGRADMFNKCYEEQRADILRTRSSKQLGDDDES